MNDTVRGALAEGIQILADAKVDSAQTTAQLLMAHVLGWDRVRVLSHGDDVVVGPALDEFRSLVRRSAAGEPLQYLTGEREFYGLRFAVSPDVLIPRPETEILVERALRLAQPRLPSGQVRFLDLGTGSGCIAVTLAKLLPCADGCAVDISPAAVAVAAGNARRHAVSARIRFVNADLLSCFAERPIFDLIVCNPPYVALEERESLPPSVREHEPHLALFGGAAGLEIHRRLIPQAARRLTPGGHLLLEMGAGQAEAVACMLERAGLRLASIDADLRGIPRCIDAERTGAGGEDRG
jgi:release factor glutamine methyltransferase